MNPIVLDLGGGPTRSPKFWAGASAAAILALGGCAPRAEEPSAQPPTTQDTQSVVDVADADRAVTPTIDDLGRLVFTAPRSEMSIPQGKCADLDDSDPQLRDGTLVWARVAGTTVPMSTTDGPPVVGQVGPPRGISATARGAALAGLNLINAAARSAASAVEVIGVASTAAPDASPEMLDRQPLIDRIVNAADVDSPGAGPAPQWATPVTDVVAYRVRGWSEQNPQHAIVDYASPSSPDHYTARSFVVHWVDDKWRLEVDHDGPTTHTAEVDNLDGWTRFPTTDSAVRVCGQEQDSVR